MSFNCKCDICGKYKSKNNVFDNRPVKITIKNYAGNKYNIYAFINIEDARDSELMDKFANNDIDTIQNVIKNAMNTYNNAAITKKNNKGRLSEDGADSNTEKQIVQLEELSVSQLIGPSLKNPTPHICTSCKKIMLQYCQSYGTENGTEF